MSVDIDQSFVGYMSSNGGGYRLSKCVRIATTCRLRSDGKESCEMMKLDNAIMEEAGNARNHHRMPEVLPLQEGRQNKVQPTLTYNLHAVSRFKIAKIKM